MPRYARNILVVVLAGVLMWLVLRRVDLLSVWSEIRRARVDLVFWAGALSVLSLLIRVIRWQGLLAPIKGVGFLSAFRATVMGFAVNALLPGRLGEVFRPYVLARREHLSASAALATIVLERLLDLIAVVLLFSVFLIGFSGGMRHVEGQMLTTLKVAGVLAGGGAVVALALIVVVSAAPTRMAKFVSVVGRLLPLRIAEAVLGMVMAFTTGFEVARQPVRLLRIFLWSIPMWLGVAAGAWCICYAFGIPLPPSGSLLLMGLMVLGVSVPTPAGTGAFHAAFQIGATRFYGAPPEAAIGAALVLHLVTFGPVAAVGVGWMVHDGLSLRGAVHLAEAGTSGDVVGKISTSA